MYLKFFFYCCSSTVVLNICTVSPFLHVPPTAPPTPAIPTPPLSILSPFGFVHVFFIDVPENAPFFPPPHYALSPPLVTVSLFFAVGNTL